MPTCCKQAGHYQLPDLVPVCAGAGEAEQSREQGNHPEWGSTPARGLYTLFLHCTRQAVTAIRGGDRRVFLDPRRREECQPEGGGSLQERCLRQGVNIYI
jgi:hypothetical protein